MKTSPLTALRDAGLLKAHRLINGERVAGHHRFDGIDSATRLGLGRRRPSRRRGRRSGD
jgi:hypothetical protein